MTTGLPPEIANVGVTLTFSFTNNSGTVRSSGYYYGYCTIADVQFEFANLRGFTTLTDSVIAQEICYTSLRMQEVLDRVYVMPYEGSVQVILQKLRELNAKLAASEIIERYYTGSSPNASEHAMRLLTEVTDTLAAIEAGLIRWDDPSGDATSRASLPVGSRDQMMTGNPDPYSGESTATPVFTMDQLRFRGGGIT